MRGRDHTSLNFKLKFFSIPFSIPFIIFYLVDTTLSPRLKFLWLLTYFLSFASQWHNILHKKKDNGKEPILDETLRMAICYEKCSEILCKHLYFKSRQAELGVPPSKFKFS